MLNRSISLGKYAGIPLRLHWTFSLIFLFVFFIGIKNNRGLTEIGVIFLFVIILFFCVVLHEYGHALMAKRFDVKTKDIILSPIGGLARLEKLPTKAIHEFYIAIAGPLVNIIISLLIALILIICSKPVFPDLDVDISSVNNWAAYLSIIFSMNMVLFLFNLIPAFPMDGGRILRSLLSLKLGKKQSTNIASSIGYILAVIFIVIGIFKSYYTLSIIGVFVMIMARGERISARQEDFMLTTFASGVNLKNENFFGLDTSMKEIINFYGNRKGRNFMIKEGDELLGVVTEESIKSSIKDLKHEEKAKDYLVKDYFQCGNENLSEILQKMKDLKTNYLVISELNDTPFIIEKDIIYNAIQEA